MYRLFLKRLIDILLAALALIVLSPLLLLISLAIKLDSKGPVFYKQKRIGKDKSYFYMWKFRSMYTDTPKDVATHLFENPYRWITPVGQFLRKTSLDELPQLWNILVGDMSIIGPRPAIWNQFDLVEERDKYGANDIRPGLSGWAQVNGRDELEIEEKARLDGYYRQEFNLLLDLRIIFKTIIIVVKSDGVVEGGPKELKKRETK